MARYELLDLPDIRQKDTYDCGPAAIKSCLQYIGFRKGYDFYREKFSPTEIDGCDPRTAEAHLRNLGLKIQSGHMTIADLRFHTSLQRPVLTLIQAFGCGHYIAVRGVSRGRVHYQDPNAGRLSLLIDDFERIWKDADRFGLAFDKFGIALWWEVENG